MGMFKKNQEKKQEENQEKIQENKGNKPKIQGKFYNLKLIKIIIAIVVLLIIYNIFKTDNKPKKVETINNEEKKDMTTKTNPYQTTYEDIKDIDITTNQTTNSTTNNNSTSIMTEEQKEKLRQLEEQANQAKKSPIAFQLYNRQDTQNHNTQTTNNFPTDYDQNRQNSKKNFLFNEAQKALYSTSTIVESISPYELKTGDFFPAVVETAMNSDIYSKVIVARVSQNIYDTVTGKYLLIPQGTTLTGVYDSNITWGQDRLLVIWQQLRFPNGDMLVLDNMQGVDMIGQAGIPGKVNNHFATLLKGVLLSSAMGAATAITTADDDDWRSDAGEGAGLAIVQIGDKYTTKALDRQPTIMIKAGDRFNVMVHSNLILKPYNK